MLRKTIDLWLQYCRDHQRVLIDTSVLIIAIICTGSYLASIEATEVFYEFSRNHEDLELDELALTIAVSSIYISIFTLRRFFDLKTIMAMANTDALVGIPNRRRGITLIETEINKCKRQSHRSSVIMFDLDNFKEINDECGHCIGDYVLQEVCLVVQKQVKGRGEVIRWGGEEFMVLCPDTSLNNAVNLAEQLRDTLEKHSFQELTGVTASFGVAEIKQQDQLDALLKTVDGRMYASKNTGKNKVTSC